MDFKHTTYSHKGTRAKNEDDFFPHENQEHNNVFMVFDGMGGHGDGDLASAFLQDELPRELALKNPLNGKAIFDSVLESNTKLKRYAQQVGNMQMGTTVAILKLERSTAEICWVGDSRVYHIRNGEILHKTIDHTLLELMKENGEITAVEAVNFPMKHVIYQALGPRGTHIAPSQIQVENVQIGDRFLLATDGLFEAWNDEELMELFKIKQANIPEELNKKCLLQAKDNFTFTLVTAV